MLISMHYSIDIFINLWVELPIMKHDIIIFRLPPNTDQRQLNRFCKMFYGQDTSSHKGKYCYRRKGLLDSIPHRKLIRGVIIVPKEHTKRVVQFLKEFDAEVYIGEITLTPDDEKFLHEG